MGYKERLCFESYVGWEITRTAQTAMPRKSIVIPFAGPGVGWPFAR